MSVTALPLYCVDRLHWHSVWPLPPSEWTLGMGGVCVWAHTHCTGGALCG